MASYLTRMPVLLSDFVAAARKNHHPYYSYSSSRSNGYSMVSWYDGMLV